MPAAARPIAATSNSKLTGPATRNGQRIYVQQISEGIEAWSSAIVGTDWPHSGERRALRVRDNGTMTNEAAS